jgi:hypothetical protein
MAGVYADIPGTRFALDQDGSVLWYRNITSGSSWTEATGSLSSVIDAGNEDYVDITGISEDHTWEIALAFPEARTINAMFIASAAGAGGTTSNTYYYSTDTTDGTDGTWTTFTGPNWRDTSGTLKPYFRADITPFGPLNNIKGLRWRQTHSNNSTSWHRIFCMHVYGSRPLSGVSRLAFWHPTLDQALGAAYLDFGDHPQGTVTTRQFRIKNVSASLTANDITVNTSDTDNEFNGNLLVSTDNTTYVTSMNIGNLAAGAMSGTLYVRRTVPGAETSTQRLARLLANAASWS